MVTPISLPPKFDSCLVNNADHNLHVQLDQIFQGLSGQEGDVLAEAHGFQPLDNKNHVVIHPQLPNWVIKGPRDDGVIATLPDTHIYRVRRALRIQNVIKNHHFSEVVVPKKLLYQHQGQWLVVASKLELDPNATLDKFTAAWVANKVYKVITPQQAKEIATLCFEGKLEDVGAHNLHFTNQGKVAILDTEPVSRAAMKALKSILRFIPNSKATIKFIAAVTNSERLYLLCQHPHAGEEIRQVQSQMFWKHLAKLVMQVAIPLILSVGTLTGALISANPILIAMASSAVVLAGVNALMGTALIIISCWKYHHIRSLMGHFELNNR